jgi:hypothetical protein
MQYLHPPLTSCITYPICNNILRFMSKLALVGPSLTLCEPLTSKCNIHIGILSKPHVEHDTCNIHI